MWLPGKAFDLFHISRESVEAQRVEIAALRAERDALKLQAQTAQSNFDWLRLRVNQLEVERAQLIKRAYNIDTAVPEVVRSSKIDSASQILGLSSALFEDVGDDNARELGITN